MTRESLQALVAGLRSELAQATELDEPARRALHQLAHELEAELSRPPGELGTGRHTLRERLGDQVRELEVSHPKLTSTLSSIIDTLAFYGL
jgi:hypothetical protein